MPSKFGVTTDGSRIEAADLYVRPPTGFRQTAVQGTLADDVLLDVTATWDAGGKTVFATTTRVPAARLPLDVNLYFSDSRLIMKPIMLAGHYAIVEEPRSGPAPNVGYVRVWLDGKELVLSSPSLGQDKLAEVAVQVAQVLNPK